MTPGIQHEALLLKVRPARHGVFLVLAALALLLSACAETQLAIHAAKRIIGPEVRQAPPPDRYKVGKPYQIAGVWYYPREDPYYDERGVASWYGPGFDGRRTANGEIYDERGLSAAHPTLPMPSWVRVTNLENGRSLVVRINDRGPFKRGRIIDLSRGAARRLGVIGPGTAKVRVQNVTHLYAAPAARSSSVAARPTIVAATGGREVASAPRIPVETRTLEGLPGIPTNGVAAARTAAKVQVSAFAMNSPNRLYVQAGAFKNQRNAKNLKTKLTNLGPVDISSVLLGGNAFHRVRLGPLASIAEADRMLARVIGAGYPYARIVVD